MNSIQALGVSDSSVSSSLHSQFIKSERLEFVSNNFLFNTSNAEVTLSEFSTLASVSINIPEEKDKDEIQAHLKALGFYGKNLELMTELYVKADRAIIEYLNTIY